MDKLYGKLSGPTPTVAVLPLPITDTLRDGTEVLVTSVTRDAPEPTLAFLQDLLNAEIRAGDSYPFEHEMDREAFLNYFMSHSAFMVTTKTTGEILGCFYIKPNFPGRASHICNGGFITAERHRQRGVGVVMGRAFLVLAPLLGYRGSLFNLVFENNIGSAKIWRRLGFTELGPVPGIARIKKSGASEQEEFVGVSMFHYDFTKPQA